MPQSSARQGSGDHHPDRMDQDDGESAPQRDRVEPATGHDVPDDHRHQKEVHGHIKPADKWNRRIRPDECEGPSGYPSLDQADRRQQACTACGFAGRAA